MPLEARLNTIESASSTERLSDSRLEMSGRAAPGRTAGPSPPRPRGARSPRPSPAPTKSSGHAGGGGPRDPPGEGFAAGDALADLGRGVESKFHVVAGLLLKGGRGGPQARLDRAGAQHPDLSRHRAA